jgi:hypothetical protein
MHMYIFYIHKYDHISDALHICYDIFMCVCASVRVCVCVCVRARIYIYIYISISIYIYIYIYSCVLQYLRAGSCMYPTALSY